LINETICDELNAAQESYLDYHTLRADIDSAKGVYHRYTYTKQEIYELVLDAHVEVEKSILTIDEPSMLNSKEKIWQFSHKIDEMIAATEELPLRNNYESRGWALKEKIRTNGFQLPPQLTLVAYKS
jgi:hypothetical protein